MAKALDEAGKGKGRTSPNPTVGAVIVSKNRLLASGWHRAAGLPHAEIEAIRSLSDVKLARDAELFVTLEPCSSAGRTPPCTDTLIAAGFSRVVYGTRDPNPAHAGRAKKLLQSARIAVAEGVLEEECRDLNRAWNKWIVTGVPWLIAKCGMSLDGRISMPPGKQWITSAASRMDAMQLRAFVDAILVGGETVRSDNPRLTFRGSAAGRSENEDTQLRQPWRVVWTRNKSKLPPEARIFLDKWKDRTLVRSDRSLRGLLRGLGRKGITSVLLEGGGMTLGAAADAGLIDEFVIYRAPVLLGGGVPAIRGAGAELPSSGISLEKVRYERIGNDLKMSGLVVRR